MPDAPPKPNRRLLVTQLFEAEFRRSDLLMYPEAGTRLDEMLIPEYWSHVARRLKAFDRIEVRPADGTWWAELLVHVVEPFAARVEVLREHHFGGGRRPVVQAPDGYEFRFRGQNGWCVVRLSDGAVLREKEGSIEAAEAWLTAHNRRLAA